MAEPADPITEDEAVEMRRTLEPLFGPQVSTWKITHRHYELLGRLIEENERCTAALHWVPRPYNWSNPLNWIRKQVRDAVRRALLNDKDRSYVVCSKAFAYKWATPFREAGYGL